MLITDRWQSGLLRQFAKLLYYYIGGSNPPLSKIYLTKNPRDGMVNMSDLKFGALSLSVQVRPWVSSIYSSGSSIGRAFV